MIKNSKGRTILYIFLLLVNLLLIQVYNLNDRDYVYLMCSNFIFILWKIWQINKLTPFMLFMTTFIILFIGGHFWGVLFNPDLPLRIGSFFDPVPSSDSVWKETMTYLFLYLYFSLIGYQYSYVKLENNSLNRNLLYQSNIPNKRFNRFLTLIFVPLVILKLWNSYKRLLMVISGGYLELYAAQTEGYSTSGMLHVIEWFFFGMAMTYGEKQNKILYVSLFFLGAILDIIGGSRGTFGCILLFTIWFLTLKYHIKFRDIFLGCTISLILLFSISMFSVRDKDNGTSVNNFRDVVALIFYAQGESLSTFESSRSIKHYPILPYFQSFIPASSFFYYHIFPGGKKLQSNETSFSLYLSSQLNSKQFELGRGTGWSFLGDLYLFSGRTYMGFILLSFLSAYVLGRLEIKSLTNNLCKVILFAIILRLLILPRAGLNYIMPLVIYVLIYYYFIKKIFKLKIQNI